MSDFNEFQIWTWVYFVIISILTLVGGAVNCVYGVIKLKNEFKFTGLCGLFSIFSGAIIILLVLVWCGAAAFFRHHAIKFRRTLHGLDSQKEKNNQKNISMQAVKINQNIVWAKKKSTEMNAQRRKILKLRFLILFSMLFAFLCEIVSTGIFWYTKTKLESTFTVKQNCFCSLDKDYQNNSHLLKRDCPFQLEDKIIYCLSVFEPEMIMHEQHTSFTLTCQTLSGEGKADPLCMEYLLFWTWFKVLRVLLPLVAAVKLPMIAVNIFFTLYKSPPQNAKNSEASFSNATWLHLDTMFGKRTIVDPVKYYENMCATIQDADAPPVGERLGPYGQEKEDEMFISIKTGKRKCATSKSGHLKPPGELEFSRAPTQLLPLNRLVRYSPPSKENNTFSTPLVNKRKDISPNFNLSQLASSQIFRSGSQGQQSQNFTDRLRKCSSNGSVNDTELKFSTFRRTTSKLLRYQHLEDDDEAEKSTSDPSDLVTKTLKALSNSWKDSEAKLQHQHKVQINARGASLNLGPDPNNNSAPAFTTFKKRVSFGNLKQLAFPASAGLHPGPAPAGLNAGPAPAGPDSGPAPAAAGNKGSSLDVVDVSVHRHESDVWETRKTSITLKFEDDVFVVEPENQEACSTSDHQDGSNQNWKTVSGESADDHLDDNGNNLDQQKHDSADPPSENARDAHEQEDDDEVHAPADDEGDRETDSRVSSSKSEGYEVNVEKVDGSDDLPRAGGGAQSSLRRAVNYPSSAPDLNNNGNWVTGESTRLQDSADKFRKVSLSRPKSLMTVSETERPPILSKKPTVLLTANLGVNTLKRLRRSSAANLISRTPNKGK